MKKMLLILSILALALSAQAKRCKFVDADKDKNGYATLEEFTKGMQAANPNNTAKKMANWFKNKDKNRDGKLTKEEFEAKKIK